MRLTLRRRTRPPADEVAVAEVGGDAVVVLIDPSWSQKADWTAIRTRSRRGLDSPRTCFVLWYPVKSLTRPNAMIAPAGAGVPGVAELITTPFGAPEPAERDRVLVVNPPAGAIENVPPRHPGSGDMRDAGWHRSLRLSWAGNRAAGWRNHGRCCWTLSHEIYDSFGPNPRPPHVHAGEGPESRPRPSTSWAPRIAGPLHRSQSRRTGRALELDDSRLIGETVAIFEYLKEKHPAPPLIGRTPEERTETRMWQRRVELNITEHLYNGFRYAGGSAVPRACVLPEPPRRRGDRARQARVARRPPRRKKFVAGDRFTIADVILYCALDFGSVGQPRDPGLNLDAWFTRVEPADAAASLHQCRLPPACAAERPHATHAAGHAVGPSPRIAPRLKRLARGAGRGYHPPGLRTLGDAGGLGIAIAVCWGIADRAGPLSGRRFVAHARGESVASRLLVIGDGGRVTLGGCAVKPPEGRPDIPGARQAGRL
jgi:glutathione S-transferase